MYALFGQHPALVRARQRFRLKAKAPAGAFLLCLHAPLGTAAPPSHSPTKTKTKREEHGSPESSRPWRAARRRPTSRPFQLAEPGDGGHGWPVPYPYARAGPGRPPTELADGQNLDACLGSGTPAGTGSRRTRPVRRTEPLDFGLKKSLATQAVGSGPRRLTYSVLSA